MEGTDESQISLKYFNIRVQYGDKVILNDLSGEVGSGQMLALMGPSGSGKSTLLNFIARRTELLSGLSHNGKILVGDKALTKSYRYVIGYVTQDDIFFETLTLDETLQFYANLRLPKSFSKEERDRIINDVIDIMELRKCLYNLVGGGMIKGISGGERKRANIACELITDPLVIMLDEPTSGLDSGMALSVVKTLKKYAVERNKIVIASIHQPNSQIFYSFDKLALLSLGELMYYGPLDGVVSFFEEVGHPCPKNWNAADYIIDMTRADSGVRAEILAGFSLRYDQKENFKAYEDEYDEKVKLQKKCGGRNMNKWPAGSWTQFKCLFKRTFVKHMDENWSVIQLFQVLFSSFFIGVSWFNTPFVATKFNDILGLCFFMTSEAISDPFFTSAFSFENDKLVVSRERMASMYHLFLYYTARFLAEIPKTIFRPLTFVLISYWISGLRRDVYFLPFILTTFLGSILGQAYGMIIGALGLSLKETLVVMVCYYVASTVLGGFYTRNLPIWLSWARYLSPFYQIYTLLSYIQLQGNILLCDSSNVPIPSCVSGKKTVDVQDVIDYLKVGFNPSYFAVIALVLLIICFISGYFILSFTITKSRHHYTCLTACSARKLFMKVKEEE